jgi:hypothetical protein
VLELYAAALERGDDARELALALHRLHVLRDDDDVRRRERVAAGRVVATSPGWLPLLAPALPRTSQRDEDAVLVLASESGPYRATRLTERLEARLLDLAAAGFRPEVVTALGFPRSAGVTEFPGIDTHAGVPHHRLDLGPFYTLSGPADLRVRDGAWLAARIANEIRPRVVHAIVGSGDLELVLVAAAIRHHLGAPLVLDFVGDLAVTPARDAAEAGAMATALRHADAVIADEPASDALLAAIAPVPVTILGGKPASARDTALRAAFAAAATRHAGGAA